MRVQVGTSVRTELYRYTEWGRLEKGGTIRPRNRPQETAELGEGSKIQGRGRRIKRLDQRRLAGSPAGAVTRGHPQASR